MSKRSANPASSTTTNSNATASTAASTGKRKRRPLAAPAVSIANGLSRTEMAGLTFPAGLTHNKCYICIFFV